MKAAVNEPAYKGVNFYHPRLADAMVEAVCMGVCMGLYLGVCICMYVCVYVCVCLFEWVGVIWDGCMGDHVHIRRIIRMCECWCMWMGAWVC